MAVLELGVVLTLATLALITFYKYMTSSYNYWKERNVPYLQPSFPFGNIKEYSMSTVDIGQSFKNLYDQMPGEKYFGIFEMGNPTLVLRDPDVIRTICTQDSSYFMDKGYFHENVTNDVFASNVLFNLKCDKWKRMRGLLSPAFTSAKVKLMYQNMYRLTLKFVNLLKPLADHNTALEFKDLMVRLTTDVISNCALGMETDAMTNEKSEIREITKLFYDTTWWNSFELVFSMKLPKLYNFLGLKHYNPKVEQFCMQITKDTYNYRVQNNVNRDDVLDALIREKASWKESSGGIEAQELTFDEIAPQVFVIFAGGFETSSTVTSAAFFEIAKQPQIQAKIRSEVDEVLRRHDGQLTYEALQELIYTEQVINEVLRLYPPIPVLHRKCVRTYRMRDSDLVIEKGMQVIVPMMGLHKDPQYFKDPHVFDPEKFSPENVSSRTPGAYLPFGEGPMYCLGKRFGEVQVKSVIATVLSEFEISAGPETPECLTIDPRQFMTTIQQPVLLKISKRSDRP